MKVFGWLLCMVSSLLLWNCNGNSDHNSMTLQGGPLDQSNPAIQISGVYADTITGESEGELVFMEVTLNPDSSFSLSRQTFARNAGDPTPIKGPREVIKGIFIQKDNWKRIKLASTEDGGHETSFAILPDALELLDVNEKAITRSGKFVLTRKLKPVMQVGEYLLSYEQKTFSRYPVQAFLRTAGNNIRIHKSYLDQAKNYERALMAYYGLKYNSGCDLNGCALNTALNMSEEEMKNAVRLSIPEFSAFTNEVVSPLERQRLSMILVNQNSDRIQVHAAYLDAKDQNYRSVDEFKVEGDKLKLVSTSGVSKIDNK